MATEINCILSIVMPIYNEEEIIKHVIEDIYTEILSKLPDSQLLAINDGSTDSTPVILDDIANRFPQIMPLHKKNGGHGDALLYGLKQAKGQYIFLMDSDKQVDPKDLWLLWNKRNEADFLCGVRTKRHDPLHRLVLTRLLRFGIWILFGERCRDANVPFKLFKRDFWEKARAFIPKDTLTPSLFLCLIAKRTLQCVKEENICHLPRKTGTCTIRYFNLLKFCLRSLLQIFNFRLTKWRILINM